jgi:cyanophycinase
MTVHSWKSGPPLLKPLLLLTLFMGACEGRGSDERAPGHQPTRAGDLVIIGGGLRADNSAVYMAVLDGRAGDGPLCVIPTASAEPESSMESAVTRFDELGGPGTALGILLTVDDPEDAWLPEVAEQIRSCSGFFFTGGVQTRIVRVFRPEEGDSPAFRALQERHAAGAVVSGSSAGAAIMTDPMTGGGSSVGALHEGIRWADGEEEGRGVILEKGMGFLDRAFVDQHFLARGRWGRLLVAVLGVEDRPFGLGVDENTALVVRGDSAWVVGESGVIFLDTRGALPDEGGHGGTGILLHLLGPGDGVHLGTGSVQRDATKTWLAGNGEISLAMDRDLFERWTLLHFLAEAALATDTLFTFHQDGHVLEFRRAPDFEARAWDGAGVEGTPRGLSVGPMVLEVRREQVRGSR